MGVIHYPVRAVFDRDGDDRPTWCIFDAKDNKLLLVWEPEGDEKETAREIAEAMNEKHVVNYDSLGRPS